MEQGALRDVITLLVAGIVLTKLFNRWLDKRILAVAMERQQVLSTDQLRLNVDAYARYRIIDPVEMVRTVGTVENVEAQLSPIFSSLGW